MSTSRLHVLKPAGYANTWLVEEDGHYMAIDVGTRRAARQVCRYIGEELNESTERLAIVTATHFHVDHIGGIEELLRLCPQARVHFGKPVAKYLDGREGLAVPSLRRWIYGAVSIAPRIPHLARGFYYSLGSPAWGSPTPLMRRRNNVTYEAFCDLVNGMSPEGFPSWRVLETPGHTPDSLCFYNEKQGALLTGDTILNLRGRGELNYFCTHPELISASYNRLLGLEVRSIYPGHGESISGMPGVLRNVSHWGL